MKRSWKSCQASSCSRYGFMPGNGEGMRSFLTRRALRGLTDIHKLISSQHALAKQRPGRLPALCGIGDARFQGLLGAIDKSGGAPNLASRGRAAVSARVKLL